MKPILIKIVGLIEIASDIMKLDTKQVSKGKEEGLDQLSAALITLGNSLTPQGLS